MNFTVALIEESVNYFYWWTELRHLIFPVSVRRVVFTFDLSKADSLSYYDTLVFSVQILQVVPIPGYFSITSPFRYSF